MPLIITLVCFGLLFALEACDELGAKVYAKRELQRHQSVEHPRKKHSDAYLDRL